jgi:hypothetical protein
MARRKCYKDITVRSTEAPCLSKGSYRHRVDSPSLYIDSLVHRHWLIAPLRCLSHLRYIHQISLQPWEPSCCSKSAVAHSKPVQGCPHLNLHSPVHHPRRNMSLASITPGWVSRNHPLFRRKIGSAYCHGLPSISTKLPNDMSTAFAASTLAVKIVISCF